MEKLIDYVSKIPRTTIVDFLGQGVVKGIQEFDNKMLSTLIDNKILTRQDLADLATDELVGKEGILQKRIEKSVAEKIIMDAREIYLNS